MCMGAQRQSHIEHNNAPSANLYIYIYIYIYNLLHENDATGVVLA